MKLILTPSKGGDSFVGLKYRGNNIELYYPETFRWENTSISLNTKLDESTVSGIRSIINSIEYAKTHSKEKTALNDNFDAEEPFAMKSYVWMIKDFMNNGSYKSRETVFKLNQKGKINWKRTLAKIPLYSNENFIYKDFVVSTKSQVNDLLVEIYNFCVKKSIYLIGWLYGIKSSSMGIKRMSDVELPSPLKNKYLHAVKYELDRTFDDEKRLRLTNMLNVIQGLNKSNNGELVYGVDGFDYVFECAVDRVLGTEKDKSNYYPFAEWSNGTKNTPLRVDSILKSNDTYVIIDAKCYQYANKGYKNNTYDGLPATDSIQKQITYGDHIKKHFSDAKEIYNCFVIPYNKNLKYGEHTASGEFLHYSGLCATANWRNHSQTHEKVYVILIDMRDILEKSESYDHEKDQNTLLKLITNIKN